MRVAPLSLTLLVIACSKEAPRDAEPALSARPLPQRVAVDGPRFQRLDSATTGLAFTNELRPENVVDYVYAGAGLAVGDYDADGLPDVYLVSQDGPNRLFRQVSPLRFVDVTAAAGGLDGGDAWGNAANFVDIDGDGDLDLYVCNLESPNLLYLNQGDGTFREAAAEFGLDIVAACTGCAFGDLDQDGDLDLYLLTNRVLKHLIPDEIVAEITLPKAMRKTKAELLPPYPRFARDANGDVVVPEGYRDFFFAMPGAPHAFQAGQRDRLLRNDGGRFVDVTDQAGIRDQGNGLSVVLWDFDGDGRLDIYVANDFQSPDQLYRNDGNGRFTDVTRETLPHTAFFGMGCDFGDLDGDGRFDLCVADMSSTTHYMGKMLMGSMDRHRWFLMNASPPQYMRNALYLNTGTGRFAEAAHLAGLASTDWTWSVRFGDLDDDGRLDFFCTNGIPVFHDDPDVNERFSRLWAEGRQREALEVYRAIPSVPERNIARRNVGELRFEDVGAAWGLDEAGVSHGAVLVDLDRDGDLDVLTNNLNQEASLFENRGASGHRVLVELVGRGGNRHGIGAVLRLEAGGARQTRLVMPTRGYMSSGEAIEHFGLGEAARIERLEVTWPSGRVQTFADLAVDQHYTIREPLAPAVPAPRAEPQPTWFVARDVLPARHRERDFDDFAAQPLLPHRLSRLGPGIAVGDVDGDGRAEVFVGGAAGQAGRLLRRGSDGTFATIDGPWQQDAECEDLGALWFDADADGDLDLYVASGGVEADAGDVRLQDRLYLNDGRGAFARAADGVLPAHRDSSGVIAAADVDGDGDLDLFVGGRVVPGRFPHAPNSRLLRNDGGRFTDVAAQSLPGGNELGMVSAACFADLDGDRRPELIVAAQWQPLRVFRNDDGVFRDRTADLGLAALRGQWFGLAAGDLDGDGDVDLVAGNLGLNTKYSASEKKPLRIYADDFDANGTLDVVEAKQVGDAMLPVRGLSCSSQAMPFVRERFPTYDAFARANLDEIYGRDGLAGSLELSCTELQHVVLRNDGDAFVVLPLPRFAQIAPVFGITITDFDGDGRADLALAQNFFSPEPETGRFDGGLGLVLRGRGDCTFEVVEPARSGFVVAGDAKALALADLDGDGTAELVVGTNDGPVRTFAQPAGDGLAIALVGPAGNPNAVGAVVELSRPDGRREWRTIAAGGGYLTQQEPVAFFRAVPKGSSLRVLWPDGQATEHPLPSPRGRVRLQR